MSPNQHFDDFMGGFLKGFKIAFAILLFIYILTFFTSCCPCRHLSSSTSDSIRIEVQERIVPVIKDTVVYVTVEKEVEKVVADSSSVLSNKWAISEAKLQGGKLYHSLETRSQKAEFEVKIEEKIVYRDSIVYRDCKSVEVVEVYKLRWWQKIVCWVGIILILLYCLK